MKFTVDPSIAEKWYLPNPDTVKGLRLRFDFHARLLELLAPDTFPAECAGMLVNAERKQLIDPGEADSSFTDLLAIGVPLHPCIPVIPRAIAISFATRLTVAASLYIALAEREQCQFLTVDQKVIRNTRKYFSFVLPFANLP